MNEKPSLAKRLFTQEIRNYTYLIGFFIVLSFFAIFAIRPNITTAISLQKELAGLKERDRNYEKAITQIIALQTNLELHRGDLYLLQDALPNTPQVNKVIDDLQSSASSSGMLLKQVDINQVNLKENIGEQSLKSFKVSIQTAATFDQIHAFTQSLIQQRRLKSIKSLSISRDISQASDSADLRVQMEISGNYL